MHVPAGTRRGHGCPGPVYCLECFVLGFLAVVLGVFETDSLIGLVPAEQARLASQQPLVTRLSLPSQS